MTSPVASNLESLLLFSKELIQMGDLDPVYEWVLKQGFHNEARMKRWLLAYSMFYHVGVARDLSRFEAEDYWRVIRAQLSTLPRGRERRHYRGRAAEKAVDFMAAYFPEAIVNSWFKGRTFQEVATAVQRLPLYGPWIAFKIADMGERVLRYPIDFSDCELALYKEPFEASCMVLGTDSPTREQIHELVDIVSDRLSYISAPPHNDRPLGLQEVETCLCKWKAYTKGHYHLGEDMEAVRKAAEWKLT